MNETLKALLAQAPWCPDLTALPPYHPDGHIDLQRVYKFRMIGDADFLVISASPVVSGATEEAEVVLDRWDHPDATDIRVYAQWYDYEGNAGGVLLSDLVKAEKPIVQVPMDHLEP